MHFLNEFILEKCILSDSFDYLYIIQPGFSVFMHQIAPQRHLKSACITVMLNWPPGAFETVLDNFNNVIFYEKP